MRSTNKSRNRNKNNRRNNNNNPGNVLNRVFDSSGPEGKVRGTPQQIIEKYQALARDAQLSGDRIAHENFLQHSEHYSRILGVAQREIDAKKEAQAAQQAAHQQKQQDRKQEQSNQNQNQGSDQPVIAAAPDQEVFPGDTAENDLVVATPETTQPARNKRKPKPKPAEEVKPEASEEA